MIKFKVVLILILLIFSCFNITSAYFNDISTSNNNLFSAGYWETSPSTTPIPTPSPVVLVINEVYDAVSEDKGNDGNSANPDEWVELYNNTNETINLKDWSLTDNYAQTIIHADIEIPARGFAVLVKDASTWQYWDIPSEALKVTLGKKIGNGLSNSGDRVILKNPDGDIVDMMSWGSDNYAFTPSIPKVIDGHSIARITDGVDTNHSVDFTDLELPTPGISNQIFVTP